MAANQVEIMESLVEDYATHTFSDEEAARFCKEASAEINGYFPKESAALVKSAALTKKGLNLKLHTLKLSNAAMRPRLVIFVAMINAMSLSSTCGYTIRADVSDACEIMRNVWKRKDDQGATESEEMEEAEAK